MAVSTATESPSAHRSRSTRGSGRGVRLIGLAGVAGLLAAGLPLQVAQAATSAASPPLSVPSSTCGVGTGSGPYVFTGSTVASTAVQVLDEDEVMLASGTSDGSGIFAVTVNSGLAYGDPALVKVEVGNDSAALWCSVGTPPGWGGTAPNLSVSQLSSSSVAGTVPAARAVMVYDGQSLVGQGTPDGSGNFSFGFTSPVAAGSTLTAVAHSDDDFGTATVQLVAPDSPAQPVQTAQTLPSWLPKKLKPRGKTVLNRAKATTVQGQPLSASVKVKKKFKKCVTVKRTKKNRKVTIVPKAQCKLTVKVTYTAPAAGDYLPLRFVKTYKVKTKA